jgi:hypothetical protein
VAFVSPSDPMAVVKVKRFSIVNSGTRYIVSEESGVRTLDEYASTGTRIAAFFQNESGTANDRFWLVFRSLTSGQPLRAWYSQDGGASWTQDTSFSAESQVGPSFAQIAFTDQPYVVYAR